MVVKVIVWRTGLNLIPVHVPQAGRHMQKEEELFTLFGKRVFEIDDGEKLLICGDLKRLVGAGIEGCEDVQCTWYIGLGFIKGM